MDTSNGQQASGTQADATTNQQNATSNLQQQNPSPQQEQRDGTLALPQQMLNQLVTILQLTIEDDCLSTAANQHTLIMSHSNLHPSPAGY